MRILFFGFLIGTSLQLLGQQPAQIKAAPSGVIAYIKDHPYETKVDRDWFIKAVNRKEVELDLSDPKYQVKSYSITWESKRSLNNLFIHGPKLQEDSSSFLKDFDVDADASFITIESIRVQRDSIEYYVPPIILNLVSSATAKNYRDSLAHCLAYLKGYPRNIRWGTLYNDLTLELTDPSYKLLDFELHIELTQALRSAGPGTYITLQKIRAARNGKIYFVNPVGIGIQ